jgi:hypothetical protein
MDIAKMAATVLTIDRVPRGAIGIADVRSIDARCWNVSKLAFSIRLPAAD